MLKTHINFNSQVWFESIKKVAGGLCKSVNESDTFVAHDDNSIDAVSVLYENRLSDLRVEMYGDAKSPQKIDHHKIIALYIQLFLENPIFTLCNRHPNKYPAPEAMLINEMFCIGIMYAVLTKWNGKQFDFGKFNGYKPDFIKLLSNYKKSHTNIDKRRNHFHFTYALAHVIYFIERDFMA